MDDTTMKEFEGALGAEGPGDAVMCNICGEYYSPLTQTSSDRLLCLQCLNTIQQSMEDATDGSSSSGSGTVARGATADSQESDAEEAPSPMAPTRVQIKLCCVLCAVIFNPSTIYQKDKSLCDTCLLVMEESTACSGGGSSSRPSDPAIDSSDDSTINILTEDNKPQRLLRSCDDVTDCKTQPTGSITDISESASTSAAPDDTSNPSPDRLFTHGRICDTAPQGQQLESKEGDVRIICRRCRKEYTSDRRNLCDTCEEAIQRIYCGKTETVMPATVAPTSASSITTNVVLTAPVACVTCGQVFRGLPDTRPERPLCSTCANKTGAWGGSVASALASPSGCSGKPPNVGHALRMSSGPALASAAISVKPPTLPAVSATAPLAVPVVPPSTASASQPPVAASLVSTPPVTHQHLATDPPTFQSSSAAAGQSPLKTFGGSRQKSDQDIAPEEECIMCQKGFSPSSASKKVCEVCDNSIKDICGVVGITKSPAPSYRNTNASTNIGFRSPRRNASSAQRSPQRAPQATQGRSFNTGRRATDSLVASMGINTMSLARLNEVNSCNRRTTTVTEPTSSGNKHAVEVQSSKPVLQREPACNVSFCQPPSNITARSSASSDPNVTGSGKEEPSASAATDVSSPCYEVSRPKVKKADDKVKLSDAVLADMEKTLAKPSVLDDREDDDYDDYDDNDDYGFLDYLGGFERTPPSESDTESDDIHAYHKSPSDGSDDLDEPDLGLIGQISDDLDEVDLGIAGQSGDDLDEVDLGIAGQIGDDLDEVDLGVAGQSGDDLDEVDLGLIGQISDDLDEMDLDLIGQSVNSYSPDDEDIHDVVPEQLYSSIKEKCGSGLGSSTLTEGEDQENAENDDDKRHAVVIDCADDTVATDSARQELESDTLTEGDEQERAESDNKMGHTVVTDIAENDDKMRRVGITGCESDEVSHASDGARCDPHLVVTDNTRDELESGTLTEGDEQERAESGGKIGNNAVSDREGVKQVLDGSDGVRCDPHCSPKDITGSESASALTEGDKQGMTVNGDTLKQDPGTGRCCEVEIIHRHDSKDDSLQNEEGGYVLRHDVNCANCGNVYNEIVGAHGDVCSNCRQHNSIAQWLDSKPNSDDVCYPDDNTEFDNHTERGYISVKGNPTTLGGHHKTGGDSFLIVNPNTSEIGLSLEMQDEPKLDDDLSVNAIDVSNLSMQVSGVEPNVPMVQSDLTGQAPGLPEQDEAECTNPDRCESGADIDFIINFLGRLQAKVEKHSQAQKDVAAQSNLVEDAINRHADNQVEAIESDRDQLLHTLHSGRDSALLKIKEYQNQLQGHLYLIQQAMNQDNEEKELRLASESQTMMDLLVAYIKRTEMDNGIFADPPRYNIDFKPSESSGVGKLILKADGSCQDSNDNLGNVHENFSNTEEVQHCTPVSTDISVACPERSGHISSVQQGSSHSTGIEEERPSDPSVTFDMETCRNTDIQTDQVTVAACNLHHLSDQFKAYEEQIRRVLNKNSVMIQHLIPKSEREGFVEPNDDMCAVSLDSENDVFYDATDAETDQCNNPDSKTIEPSLDQRLANVGPTGPALAQRWADDTSLSGSTPCYVVMDRLLTHNESGDVEHDFETSAGDVDVKESPENDMRTDSDSTSCAVIVDTCEGSSAASSVLSPCMDDAVGATGPGARDLQDVTSQTIADILYNTPSGPSAPVTEEPLVIHDAGDFGTVVRTSPVETVMSE